MRATDLEGTILFLLNEYPDGLTNQDLAEKTSYHGPVSGMTSTLHYEERIARLKEKRGKWAIYVSLEHINGRDTIPFNHRTCPNCGYDLTGGKP